MIFALVLAAAHAADPPTPPTSTLFSDAEAVAVPTIADRIAEAVRLRQAGDLNAARSLLIALEPHLASGDRAEWLYQRGICEELAFKPEEAREFYTAALNTPGPVALDARFRRALVLEALGDPQAALADVLALARLRGLDENDAITLALQRGISEVDSGRGRKGVRRIQTALAAVEGGDTHRYMRAKARYTLARALLDEAADLSLDVPAQKRAGKNLVGRAERMKAAEEQIISLIQLAEPEWIHASLLALGDSYGELHRALIAAPPPRGLTAPQVTVYRAEIAKRAEVARTKAWHCYEQGIAVARRLAFESPRVATLHARQAAMKGEH